MTEDTLTVLTAAEKADAALAAYLPSAIRNGTSASADPDGIARFDQNREGFAYASRSYDTHFAPHCLRSTHVTATTVDGVDTLRVMDRAGVHLTGQSVKFDASALDVEAGRPDPVGVVTATIASHPATTSHIASVIGQPVTAEREISLFLTVGQIDGLMVALDAAKTAVLDRQSREG